MTLSSCKGVTILFLLCVCLISLYVTLFNTVIKISCMQSVDVPAVLWKNYVFNRKHNICQVFSTRKITFLAIFHLKELFTKQKWYEKKVLV